MIKVLITVMADDQSAAAAEVTEEEYRLLVGLANELNSQGGYCAEVDVQKLSDKDWKRWTQPREIGLENDTVTIPGHLIARSDVLQHDQYGRKKEPAEEDEKDV